MNMKRTLAALVALCLMLCGCVEALAEEKEVDVVEDLLRYFLGITDEDVAAAEQRAAEAENANADVAPEDFAQPEDYVEGEEEYVFDEIEQDIVVEDPVEVTDLAVTQGLPDDWLNILLLGTDSRGTTKYLRTDTMVILSVNEGTGAVKLTSVMRDIWVEIPGYNGQKLNAACVYGGPELTVRLINDYFDMNIENYALVNMECLVKIVDTLGGIRLDVSKAESRAISKLNADTFGATDGTGKYISSGVPSGEQVLLDGKQVLAYSRIRKLDSDYARTERQRTVLVTIAKRLQQENLFSLAGIVTSLLQYVETNMSFDEIMTIAKACMGMDMANLTQFRIPADDTYEDGMFGNTWCIKPDFEANAKLLHEFIYE